MEEAVGRQRHAARRLLDELNDFTTATAALQRTFEALDEGALALVEQVIQWQNADNGDVQEVISDYESDERREIDVIDSNAVFLVMGKPALLFAASIYDEELAELVWRGFLRVRDRHPQFNLLLQVMDNTRDSHGFCSLHYAIEAQMDGFLAAVCTWLARENGASFRQALVKIRTQDVVLPVAAKQLTGKSITSGGCTLLHVAARKGELDTLELLMEEPIALSMEDAGLDWDGLSLLELAVLHRREQVCDFLKSHTSALSTEIDRDQLQSRRDEVAVARYAASMVATEPMTKREVFDSIWSINECESVLLALHSVTERRGWSKQRHTSYPTTDLPCYQVASVDAWVRRSIERRLFTQIYARYTIPTSKMLTFRELFYVKYEARDGEQAELALHCDGSVLSFNILLNPESEFHGGGTYFEEADTTVHIKQGDAVVHSGKVRHAGAAVTSGKRTILVGFLDLVDRVLL